MNDILKSLKDIFEQFGIDTLYLIISLLVLAVLKPIWKGIKWLILRRNQKLLDRDLSPFFSHSDVEKATRYYIQTKFQNISPSEDDEPNKKYIASAKQKIIPLFLKEVFKSGGNDNKYYLILADSGMGKTTFMINLYLQYKNQMKIFGIKHKIVLFPLGSPDALKSVEKIEDKKNTILLLDAFDEDIDAVTDHKTRMKKILHHSKEFREIVITCRTQFFPSNEEIPTEAGYIKTYGDSGTEYKFQKLYLSVFDDRDIDKYLKKSYSFYQWNKRKKAKEIVKKSPNLVMRPMLLSYIDDLVGEKKQFKYSYEIYEILIRKWIERESGKHAIGEKYGKENYKKLLYDFSQALALNLYKSKERRGGYFIEKGEEIGNQLKLEEIETYDDSEKDLKGKSLLNRNAEGRYKFAHKSILEYFLAKKCFIDDEFYSNFDFDGMSLVISFFEEMIVDYFSVSDATTFFKNQTEPIQNIVRMDKYVIPQIQNIKIRKLFKLDIRPLLHFKNTKKLVVFDKELNEWLYSIWSLSATDELGEIELKERLKKLKLFEIVDYYELVKSLNPEMRSVWKTELELNHLEWEERRSIEDKINLLFASSDKDLSSAFEPINKFLLSIKKLKEKLPK